MMGTLVELVVDHKVRGLCCRAYPNHPRGCPNYDKRDGCPPRAPLIEDVLDLSKNVWAVWVDFNLAEHREKLRVRHSGWSKRQLDCCLYWQGGVKKRLRDKVAAFCEQQGRFNGDLKLRTLYVPEAMGVNVTATMWGIGVELEWPPETIVRKVAIVGVAYSDVSIK